MKAIVTGANGLIGAHVVRALLAEGHKVRALVRASSDLSSLDGLSVEFVQGDVLDPASLVDAVCDCDTLFHTAAVFAYWGHTAAELTRIAVDGTGNILRAAREARIRRVVLTSSSVVLGSSLRREIRTEANELNEKNPSGYVCAKVAQEQTAFGIAAKLGLTLVAVLPTITVGPHDLRLGPSNGIICSYLQDPWKITWSGGCNVVAVEDVAHGHLLAASYGRPGARYLLGAENLEWAQIHRLISELCGVAGPMMRANHTAAFLAATAQEIFSWATRTRPLGTRTQAAMVGRYYWYAHNRAAAELGYSPRPARMALASAIGWLARSAHLPPWVRATLRLAPEADVA